jgi:hypothetical protein
MNFDLSSPSIINIVLIASITVVILLIIYNTIKVNNTIYDMPQVSQLDVSKCNCNNKPVHALPTHVPKVQVSDQIEPMNTKPTLTLYYTDWCGYSRMFLPEWAKIKESEISTLVNFEQYECDNAAQKCAENKIRGFPSLILHKADGKKVNFPDTLKRDLNGVISFVKSNL